MLYLPPLHCHGINCNSTNQATFTVPTQLYPYHSTAPCCWLYWICASTTLFLLVSMLPYQPPRHFHGIQCASSTSTTTIVTLILILYPLHYEYYAISTTNYPLLFCLNYHTTNPVPIVSYLLPSLLNLKFCCLHFNMPLTHHCCY